jgi:GntR family transcriptional regulator/MocR family aminotransferase
MKPTGAPFIMLSERGAAGPIYRQIYAAIRRSILIGEFASGLRLPASRSLAEQLGVARMTVINAYEQLLAEGYLEGRAGAGTYVASHLPEEFLQIPRAGEASKTRTPPPRKPNLSAYGAQLWPKSGALLRSHSATSVIPFQHGLPAIDRFPFAVWAKIAQKWEQNPPAELLGYGDPRGYRPLREAIAAHLASSRGVRCTPEQIIVINGTQQGVDLIGRVLVDSGDDVWMEDPCFLGARDIFASLGARIVPAGVDPEGFDLRQAQALSPTARLAYVTPSHQFPLGVTMSLSRRLNLLEWARENDGWLIEDDYNSEYRYAGRPLASLQGLDRDERVIYLYTFSKTIFPALRLGCLVAPSDLVDVFSAARALADLHSPTINQAILAEFIAEGHFARHLRRMRGLYQERQAVLIEAAQKYLSGFLTIAQAESGMHVIGWLPAGVSDRTVTEKATRAGLKISPLSAYRNKPSETGGLVLGYTAFDERQIRQGVRKLAQACLEV